MVARGATMQILVIEDEPRILSFLARGLEAEGFRVDAADTGPMGLKQALARPYDLSSSTCCFPGLDGLTVLRELQERRARAARRDRLGPLRPADEAARLRSRSERLPGEAVRARRVGRAAPSRSCAARGRHDDQPRPRRDAHARSRAPRRRRSAQLVADLSDREFRLLHHLVEHAGRS